MKKDYYTYSEAIALIKEKLAANKSKKKTKTLVHGDIAEFCKEHDLEYYSLVNCLNSKTETRPLMVKKILEILIGSEKIKHKKQNIYYIDKQ